MMEMTEMTAMTADQSHMGVPCMTVDKSHMGAPCQLPNPTHHHDKPTRIKKDERCLNTLTSDMVKPRSDTAEAAPTENTTNTAEAVLTENTTLSQAESDQEKPKRIARGAHNVADTTPQDEDAHTYEVRHETDIIHETDTHVSRHATAIEGSHQENAVANTVDEDMDEDTDEATDEDMSAF